MNKDSYWISIYSSQKKKKKEKESSVGNWQNKVYLLLGIKCS
jgi:hypothetical protein